MHDDARIDAGAHVDLVADRGPELDRPADLTTTPELPAGLDLPPPKPDLTAPKPDLGLDPPAACGRPSAIQDDFDDGVPASQWGLVKPAGSTLSESGGWLVVTPGAGQTAEYRSLHAVNLDEDRLRVEVPAMVNTATQAGAYLAGEFDAQNQVLFVQQGGTLYSRLILGGVPTQQGISYDPAAHRYWQIRETAGALHWETSPDGMAWTQRMKQPTPAFARAVRIVLGASMPATGAPSTAAFDNLDLGRPRASWCAASSFSDDFDGALAPEWRLLQSGPCTVQETSVAAFTLEPGGTSQCAFQTTAAYDLRGSSVMVNIKALTVYFPPVGAYLAVELDSENRLSLEFEGTTPPKLRARARAAKAVVLDASSNYATTQEWWRIRESGGTVSWEAATSVAGPWVTLATLATPFAVDAVHGEFGVATTAAISSAIPIGFTSYNK